MKKYKAKIFLLELVSVVATILGGYIYIYPVLHPEANWAPTTGYIALAIWILTCIAATFAVSSIHPPKIDVVQLHGAPYVISTIPTVTDVPRGYAFMKADQCWYYFEAPDGDYCKLKK